MAIGYPLGIGVTGDTVNTNYTGIIMLKGDKDALVDGDMRMVWAEGMATVQQYDLGAWRDGVLQAKEVMSGLGNLLLGGQHTISSGAESIFFKNTTTSRSCQMISTGILDQSLPEHQGPDGIIPACVKRYSENMLELDLRGAMQPSGSIEYAAATYMTESYSMYGIKIVVEEAVAPTDILVYGLYSGPDESGIQVYEQEKNGITLAAGEELEWWYDHPLEVSGGKTYYADLKILKAGGLSSRLLVRPGTPDTRSYLSIMHRTFVEADMVLLEDGVLPIDGYTQLGLEAPAIKMKKLTGTTSYSENSSVEQLHGLDGDKILGVTGVVEYNPGYWVTPGYDSYDRNFGIRYDDNYVKVRNLSNSYNIRNKPYKLTITYEA